MTTSIHTVACCLIASLAVAAESVKLQVLVRDESGAPLPSRVHLFDSDEKPVSVEQYPFFRDHFVCDGRAEVELRPGSYRYLVARGPEYRPVGGTVTLASTDPSVLLGVTLQRISEVRKRGWYSADLHIHRSVRDIQPLMMAEDLDFGPVITWWNKRNPWRDQPIPSSLVQRFDGHRIYHVMAGEDEREGGALLFFGLQEPIDITAANREYPSPMTFVRQAETANPNVWIDIEKPFWWDVPVWLSSGKADSIGLANNHMWRAGMLPTEAWGRARDKQRFPDPLGNAYWTQEIYYHILNCGFRLPPSAGSASGVLPNPVGYNRVYVHLDGELTREAWWNGLRAGRCFVTNGPMLICRANGQLPGHVFKAGSTLPIRLQLDLTSVEEIESLELIHNGEVVKEMDYQPGGPLTTDFTFDQSGWFLVRALTKNQQTFRFASTGPFYLEVGTKQKHISRDSVEFFKTWVTQRIERVDQALRDGAQRDEVLGFHFQARRFWASLANAANE